MWRPHSEALCRQIHYFVQFLPNCRTLSRRRQGHRVVKVVLEAVHSNNTRQSFVLVHDTEDKKTDLAEHY
jgi:hypothetical protein